MENTCILITGGCGFIGSNITQYLLENKVKKVIIVDNLSTGKKENIQFLLDKYSNLEFIYGDISKLEICRKAVKNVDIICHQAALGSVPRSIDNPLNSHISNVNGFLNILIAAREKGIKRIVYASSSSVYGDHPELPKQEEKVGSVLSPYAATKKIDEIYANVFTKCYDMECIGLRYFNVFGPRQDPHGAYAAVIPKFIDIMKNDKQPTINGDGTYSRDFTYVDNVVQGNVLALTTNNKKCFGEIFNIGAGGRVTLLELVSNINKYLQKDISPIFGTNRPGDIPHSNASVSKAREMLNYDPKINFEEGIKKTIDHYTKKLTIYFPYYNQPDCLKKQLNNFLKFDSNILKYLNIIIVDDGSFQHPALPIIQSFNIYKKINIQLIKINIDIPWNQPEANNVAFRECKTKYMIRTDIDHYFDEVNIVKILNYPFKNKYYYSFNRKNEQFNSLNSPPNIYIMKKTDYFKIGGYNEYFSGNYGDDIEFLPRANKLLTRILIDDIFSIVDIHNGTKSLLRDISINRNKIKEINRPHITYTNEKKYIIYKLSDVTKPMIS